jgi:hypothetical protein
MRKEDLKASFDKIKPGESDKKRMLDNILNQYEKKKGFAFLANLNYKKAIPTLALAVAIAAGSAGLLQDIEELQLHRTAENSVADDAGLSAREDMAAPLAQPVSD